MYRKNQEIIIKKIVFIGQALPEKKAVKPFGNTRLYQWFSKVNLKPVDINSFHFMALVNFFPGKAGKSHNPPTKKQIMQALPGVIEKLKEISPDIVIPVGTLAIREVLCNDTLKLNETVGNKYICDPFSLLKKQCLIIPLPHPSGASPWVHMEKNGTLLNQALFLLQKELED